MQTPRLMKRTRANGTDCYYTDLRGKQFGLGSDFAAAQKQFGELLAGREPDDPKIPDEPEIPDEPKFTVGELIELYRRHARIHYWKNGEPTAEQDCISAALRFVNEHDLPAVQFGPRALKAVRQRMIDAGLARTTINNQVNRIRRMFRWAADSDHS